MVYTTPAFNVFDNYIQKLTNLQEVTKFKSAVVRYLSPALGGPKPISARASAKETIDGLQYLSQINIEEIFCAMSKVEAFFENQKLPKEKRRPIRATIKKFIQKVEDWGYFKNLNETNPNQATKGLKKVKYSYEIRSGGKVRIATHGRKTHSPFALMAKNTKGSLIYPNDSINVELEKELKDYTNFLKVEEDYTPASIKMKLDDIYRILGWLHRYKKVELEDLRLTSMISYVPLVIEIDKKFKSGLRQALKTGESPNMETYNNYVFRKGLAKELASIEADDSVRLVKEYCKLSGFVPRTTFLIISTFCSISKFLYRNEVGTEDYPEVRDIPVFRKLFMLRKIYEKKNLKTPDAVPHSEKSVPWETALEVLETVRKWAETKELTYNHSDTGKVRQSSRARNEKPVADDLQRFLILAFFLLIPPNRSRTIYELEVGRTLVCGSYDGTNFIPEEKMINSTEAKWYIHLEASDYKTGKFYGTWWGEIPNIEFSDGKTFYYYIDLWLTWGRNLEGRINHNFFFRGSTNYERLKTDDIQHMVMRIFRTRTGVLVTPKELRKMYVTFLRRKEATDAEFEAAACAMHHSRRMQSKIYDQLEQFKRIRPAFEFNAKYYQEFFLKAS